MFRRMELAYDFFIMFLQIHDIDNVRCGITDKSVSTLNGRIIWTLFDLDLCPTDIGLIIPVAFGVLGKYKSISVWFLSILFHFCKNTVLQFPSYLSSVTHYNATMVTNNVSYTGDQKETLILLVFRGDITVKSLKQIFRYLELDIK